MIVRRSSAQSSTFNVLLIASILASILASCTPQLDESDIQPAVDALSQSLTAIATQSGATPTTTETGLDGAAIRATAEVAATRTAESLQVQQVEATRATEATIQAAGDLAAPIRAQLPSYGVDPSQGRLGWIHPPVTIFVEGYQEYAYENQKLATVARDFVLSADITWNTRFGTTGCGFVIRSNGDEEAVDQYLVIATRGALGHVGFIVQQDGEVIRSAFEDIYAYGIDPEFDFHNDATNRLTVVGRGDTFTIYTNNTLIGEITGGYNYLEGFVAFVALNESGDTTCHYSNAWLWLLE